MNKTGSEPKDIPTVRFSKSAEPELEFEVLKLSELIRRVKNTEIIRRPHRLDFYNVLHITSGKGVHSIDFQKFRYNKGDTLLIGKGQVHSFLEPENAEGILTVFTEKFLYKNIVKSDYLSIYSLGLYKNAAPVIRPGKKSTVRLSADAENIYNEYHFGEDAGKELMMQCLLKIFLIRLERCRTLKSTEQLNPEYAERFRIFLNLLERNCTKIREA
ncbi:MAG TPA: AraC family ligand binding domain-containing protein, partial [Leptospiraceae bacterium]|nr:AraC family ligand binding domain-containing protein [Leptospiraceae bacterium]